MVNMSNLTMFLMIKTFSNNLVITIYDIIISKQAAKFIKSLQPGYRNKIKIIFNSLRENPYSYPYKKIRGETNLYRIRVGNYRILYEINKENNLVIYQN